MAQQRDDKAVHKSTLFDYNAKLARAETRILALWTTIDARRVGAACPRPAPSVVPNLFGNLNLPQDNTLAVLSFQLYRTQTINFLFSNLAVWYLAINKLLFKVISKNTLAFINIFKLSMNYNQDCEKMKVFKVNNALAVDSVKEDALLSNVKGPSHLFQSFLLYSTIFFYFTPPTI